MFLILPLLLLLDIILDLKKKMILVSYCAFGVSRNTVMNNLNSASVGIKKAMLLLISFIMPMLMVTAVEINVAASQLRGLTEDEIATLASADELVKTGAGTLSVGYELKDFAGVIRVQQGAYMVTTNGALGKASGATYISAGASLVLNSQYVSGIKLDNEPVHIAGAGTETYEGAVCNIGKEVSSAFKNLILDGDATLGIPNGGGRFDVRDGAVTMNGYTLTFSVRDPNRNVSFTRTNLKGGGHIVVERGRFQIEGTTAAGYDWEGSADNTLTVKSGAYLQRSESKSRIPWSLILEKGAKVPSLKATLIGNSDGDDWAGPVQILGKQGETSVTGPYTDNAPLRFSGPISGIGMFHWTRGWVMLSNPANTFAGTWRCLKDGADYRAGLVIESTGAVSTVANSIIIGGGATFSLPADEPYQLPPLDFQGSRDIAVNGGSGTAAALKKSGAGTVVFGGHVAVTGTTEIAEGVLRLDGRVPYGKSGLWYGLYKASGVDEDTAGKMVWKRDVFKDCVTNTIFFAYQVQDDRVNLNTNGCCATYSGYLWNRSPTSETWTVTADMTTGAFIYLNDAKSPLQQFASNGRAFHQLTLNPGANYLEVRIYRGDSWTPYANNSDPNWPSGLGLAYAIGGGVTDPAMFRKFEDPGDGSLLTCDLAPRTELDASLYRASFDNLKLAGGVLDLNDREIKFTAKSLSGYGTISNGVFELNGTWTLSGDDIAAGGVAFGNADVKFGELLSFDTSVIARNAIPDEGIVFASVEEGVIKGFTEWVSPDGWFKVKNEGDGKLRLFKVKYGLKFVVR